MYCCNTHIIIPCDSISSLWRFSNSSVNNYFVLFLEYNSGPGIASPQILVGLKCFNRDKQKWLVRGDSCTARQGYISFIFLSSKDIMFNDYQQRCVHLVAPKVHL